ncbi:MAG: hypothetical protein P1U89_08070 [Verrucomicrobiales bacterium]|nr:hypothetical protein [Verrucomicrobiales bacterium]
MKELLGLAAQFRALEPWEKMNENELFGIRDPETNELHLVSVLGQAGAVFSLHCHLAPEGIEYWQNALRGIAPVISPGLPEIRLLECDFVDETDASKEDVEWYRKHSRRPRRKKAFPCFRSYRPGFYPWFIEESEARKLILIFKLFNRFYKEVFPKKKEYYQWKNPFGDMPGIPVFAPNDQGSPRQPENWDVQVEVLPSQAIPFFGPEYDDELNLSELSHYPIVDEVWELGTFFMATPVHNGPRPYYPKTAICLRASDEGSRCPCDPIVYNCDNKSDYEAIRQAFRELVNHCRYLPEKIRVENKTVKAALRTMIEDYDVEVTFEDQVLMPALVSEIMKSMEDSTLNWEDEILSAVVNAIPEEFHSKLGDEDLDRTIQSIADRVFQDEQESEEEFVPLNVIMADFSMAAATESLSQMD